MLKTICGNGRHWHLEGVQQDMSFCMEFIISFKTQMTGFFQTTFYFGYMFLISLTLGTLSGTIGHFAASRFVRTIFGNVKVD